MAETADLAPTRRRTRNGASTTPRARRTASARAEDRSADLEGQVERLQADLKAITQTLARLSSDKVTEVRGVAKEGAKSLVDSGRSVVDDATDQVNALERQLKTVIRDRPLTAIGAAVGVGFILALLARQ